MPCQALTQSITFISSNFSFVIARSRNYLQKGRLKQVVNCCTKNWMSKTKTLVVIVVGQGFSPQQINLQVKYNIFNIYCMHFSEGWLLNDQTPTEYLQNKGRKNVICRKWSRLGLCTRLYMKVNDSIFIIGNIQCFLYINDMALLS